MKEFCRWAGLPLRAVIALFGYGIAVVAMMLITNGPPFPSLWRWVWTGDDTTQ